MKIRSLRTLALFAALSGLPALNILPGFSGPAIAHAQSASDLKSFTSLTLPADALEVSAAVKAAKPGQPITLRGYIALAKDAFTPGAFTLTEILPTDAVQPGAKDLPATTAVPADRRAIVKLIDSGGKPITADLNGKIGFKPGAEVFVAGTVESGSAADALVVAATTLHIPRSPLPIGAFTEQPAATIAAAKDLSELRKAGNLKPGDPITFRARIGGSKDPFVAGRAVATLMGRALKACSENPDDHCPTPWDYCCETKADITANSATVQLTDDKGQVLRTDLKGRHNLKELTEVLITGKIAVADAKALVVNATSITVPTKN